MAENRGPVALAHQIGRVRMMFKYADDRGLIDRPVADALADFDKITPAVLPQVFQPEIEAERLHPVLNRHLRQLLALGASDELSIAEEVRTPDKALGAVRWSICPK